MKRVLFVCVGNAGRSQMAEALFNYYAAGRDHASSAGTQPASQIDPKVVEVMRELGIDISSRHPKMLTTEVIESADLVVTMGCDTGNLCPVAWVTTEDWQLEDPKGKPIEKVRQVRDEIEAKVKNLIEEL